ncbi:MAG: hypothetical protein IH577_00010 [Deltaproteobacteria bacterium]|nr:hypothetical protein [Deltaproteobacteria bacterium]
MTVDKHLLRPPVEKVLFYFTGLVPFAIVSSNALNMPAGAASLSSDRFPSKHVLPFDRIIRAGHDEYSIRDSSLEVNPP